MALSQRVFSVSPPPLREFHAKARELVAKGADVISLGQAVPTFAPPKVIAEAIHNAFNDPFMHRYSPDEGIPQLRDALAEKLACYNNIWGDPSNEIIITGGANQAFMTALLTVTDVGDDVLLPAPYFVNHEMALRICGRNPVQVPLREEASFEITLDALLKHITANTTVLVIVSPNNPTGAVYDKEELTRCASSMASPTNHYITRLKFISSSTLRSGMCRGTEDQE